jgi:hypothetical protein
MTNLTRNMILLAAVVLVALFVGCTALAFLSFQGVSKSIEERPSADVVPELLVPVVTPTLVPDVESDDGFTRPTGPAPPSSIRATAFNFNLEVVSDTCEPQGATRQRVVLYFREAEEPRDAYISDGESVQVFFARTTILAVPETYLGSVAFHWPVLELNIPLQDGGTSVFYGEALSEDFVWGRWEEHFLDCETIREEPRPDDFTPTFEVED